MDRLLMGIATGGFAGRLQKAHGTWGSAAAFLPWLFIRGCSLPVYLAILASVFIIGFFASGAAEKILDQPAPACIVIDRILGMLLTLTASPGHPAAWVLAFILFRIFAIFKPYPVSWIGRHIHGGLGIMLDDVIAGLYALTSLQIISMFFR